ncbi:hypothetical protein [Enterobacter phage vB-EclM_KMB20]|nr:hypothetical protein [Enterobacter phage vB-EclM_KMB20]
MKYITYLTIYSGTKLPPFYIGSTYLEKHIKDHYHGSIKSKKYKETYDKELKEHPELFDSCIIEEFDTRKEATFCELYYQKLYDVVKSEQFFNMAFATENGCFGMDTSGENNPFYGKTHSDEFSKAHSNRMSGSKNPMYGRTGDDCPNGRLTGKDNPFYGKTHNEEAKLKCGLKNRKSPVWEFESALRDLWLELDKPKVNKFAKEAISRGFPVGSYKNIVRSFERGLNDSE